jgi:CRISPR/Cas system-associated exonuclease Cas4 (RecB family)
MLASAPIIAARVRRGKNLNKMNAEGYLSLKALQPTQRSSDHEEYFRMLCQEQKESGAGDKVELLFADEWDNTAKAMRENCELGIRGKWERSAGQIVLGEGSLIVLQPETVVTASTLAEVSFCPRAYAALKEMPPGEMNYSLLLGILLHHAFAALLKSDKNVDKDKTAWQAIEQHRNSIADTPFAPSDDGLAFDIVSHLQRIEPWLKELKIKYNGWESRVEEPLQSPGLGLKGRIDGMLISPDNGSALILELKTGRAGGLYPPLEHQMQLTCYAMLVEELLLKPGGMVRCFALYSNEPHYFPEREALPHSRRRLQALDTRNLIVGIDKSYYIPPQQNIPHCWKCHFKSECEKHIE